MLRFALLFAWATSAALASAVPSSLPALARAFSAWDRAWTENNNVYPTTLALIETVEAEPALARQRKDELILLAARRYRREAYAADMARLLRETRAAELIRSALPPPEREILRQLAANEATPARRGQHTGQWTREQDNTYRPAASPLIDVEAARLRALDGAPAALYDLGRIHAEAAGVPQRGYSGKFWLAEAARLGVATTAPAPGAPVADRLAFYEQVAAAGSIFATWDGLLLRLSQLPDPRAPTPLLAEVERLAARDHGGALLLLAEAHRLGHFGLGDLEAARDLLYRQARLGPAAQNPVLLELRLRQLDDEAARRRGLPLLAVPAAYPTIQAAIDAAAPGQIVEIARGVYAENLVIAKPLVLRAAPGGVTLSATKAPTVLVRDAAGVHLHNLTLEVAYDPAQRIITPNTQVGGEARAVLQVERSRIHLVQCSVQSPSHGSISARDSRLLVHGGALRGMAGGLSLAGPGAEAELVHTIVATASIEAAAVHDGARLAVLHTAISPYLVPRTVLRLAAGARPGRIEVSPGLESFVFEEAGGAHPLGVSPLLRPGPVPPYPALPAARRSALAATRAAAEAARGEALAAWSAAAAALDEAERSAEASVAAIRDPGLSSLVHSTLYSSDFMQERLGYPHSRERARASRFGAAFGEHLARALAATRLEDRDDIALLLDRLGPAARLFYEAHGGTGYAVALASSGLLDAPPVIAHPAWPAAARQFLLPGDAAYVERLHARRRAEPALPPAQLSAGSIPYHWRAYELRPGVYASFPLPPSAHGTTRFEVRYGGAFFRVYPATQTLPLKASPRYQDPAYWAADERTFLQERRNFLAQEGRTALAPPVWARLSNNSAGVLAKFSTVQRDAQGRETRWFYHSLLALRHVDRGPQSYLADWESAVVTLDRPCDDAVALAFHLAVKPAADVALDPAAFRPAAPKPAPPAPKRSAPALPPTPR